MAPGCIEGTSERRGQTLKPQSTPQSSDKAPPSKASILGQTPATGVQVYESVEDTTI